MKIIDTHCDALYRLQNAKWNSQHLNFLDAEELDTNLTRLKKGNVKVQFFAIFLDPDEVPSERLWYAALEQIEIFQAEILDKYPEVKHIRKWDEINQLKDNEIGAVLTLEGADCIGNDLEKLQYLYEQGILSVGLTWNPANLCADGAAEPRGAGLTSFGKRVVELNNEFGIFTDVSHLCEQAFWDVIEIAAYPFASHSNARAICDHPRNLNDKQIQAMIEKNAPMHLVFHPPFINTDSDEASIDDLINHVEHIRQLGGVDIIGFGSDFDGIELKVEDLEHAGAYGNLLDKLSEKYSEEELGKFTYKNFLQKLPVAKA